jgi:hypothetical protein
MDLRPPEMPSTPQPPPPLKPSSKINELLVEIRNHSPQTLKKPQEELVRGPFRSSIRNIQHHLRVAIDRHRVAIARTDEVGEDEWSDSN